MGGMLINPYQVVPGSVVPPTPSAVNAVLIVSVWNWKPDTYPAGIAANYTNLETDVHDVVFTESAPYPIDWAAILGQEPYLVNTWTDQTANNDLTAGGARPTLSVGVKALIFDGIANTLSGANPLFPAG